MFDLSIVTVQSVSQWTVFVLSQWTRPPAWTEFTSSAQVFFKWNNSDPNDYLSLFIDVISVGVIPWNLPAAANLSVHHHHHHHVHLHQCAAVQTVCSVTTRIKTVFWTSLTALILWNMWLVVRVTLSRFEFFLSFNSQILWELKVKQWNTWTD